MPPEPPPQVLAKSAALEVLRASWEGKLLSVVGSKVADAHAHASKALTDTLKATPDGRPSLIQLNRSPSFKAALARLDELWTALAGPSVTSLGGAVRDARESLFRAACDLWFPLIPEEYRARHAAEPSLASCRAVRAAALHGYDPRQVLEGPIRAAQRGLKAALEQAGRRSAPGHVEDDLLRAWRGRAAAAIGQTVKTLLNDSVEHADTEAGRDLIHDDFLD